MIEGYTLPEMGEIWTDTYKLTTWLEGRYIHLGLTSSDILDTGLALQMVASLNLILEKLEELIQAITLAATIAFPRRPL